MTNAKHINEILNQVAPYELAEGWDNCGLLVDCGGETDKILFALDVSGESVKKAKELGCGIIVSHHPAIFGGVKSLGTSDPALLAAMEHISLLAAHTCFDAANGGVNDVLCRTLGIKDAELFPPIGRGGSVAKTTAAKLASDVKKALCCESVALVDCGTPIERVALIGGSAGEFIASAKWLGYDAFVTGELKYHDALFAREIGMNVIAAGHFNTEVIAVRALRDAVSERLEGAAECIIFENEKNPISYI